jgi:uncharacterized protein
VDDIITVLTTDTSEWQRRPAVRLDNRQAADPGIWLLVIAVFTVVVLLTVSPGFRWLFLNIALNILLSSGGSRSSSGGFSSGGGFSGGGGSSGGGGASGSW